MNDIYTCPYCGRRYIVKAAGNYVCECGVSFNYPGIISSMTANYAAVMEQSPDPTCTSVHRNFRPYTGASWLKCCAKKDCPYAKAAFIMGLLGLPLFGLLSLPAVIAGYFAREMIADSHLNYKGDFMANAGILLGIAGILGWGAFLILNF